MNAPCKAACVAATLVGVWGSAEAQDFYAYLYNSADLTSAVGLYRYNSSADGDEILTSPDAYGSLEARTSANPHTFDVDERKALNTLNTGLNLTLAGLYDDANDGVTILLNASTAQRVVAEGLEWDEVFLPGTDGYRSESSFASTLRSINADPFGYLYTLNDFMTDYASLMPGWNEAGVLVSFSTATATGVGGTQPVPEPASLAALGVGIATLARRRRRA